MMGTKSALFGIKSKKIINCFFIDFSAGRSAHQNKLTAFVQSFNPHPNIFPIFEHRFSTSATGSRQNIGKGVEEAKVPSSFGILLVPVSEKNSLSGGYEHFKLYLSIKNNPEVLCCAMLCNFFNRI